MKKDSSKFSTLLREEIEIVHNVFEHENLFSQPNFDIKALNYFFDKYNMTVHTEVNAYCVRNFRAELFENTKYLILGEIIDRQLTVPFPWIYDQFETISSGSFGLLLKQKFKHFKALANLLSSYNINRPRIKFFEWEQDNHHSNFILYLENLALEKKYKNKIIEEYHHCYHIMCKAFKSRE